MSARNSDPLLPVDNPALLIRSRIREKRIFEARFLYRQLGDEIREREKSALARELTGLLAQVDKLQQQARQQLATGRNDRAAALYREIERIAIDVPGVSEERTRMQGAEAIIAKVTGKTLEERQTAHAEPAAVLVSPGKMTFAADLRQRWKRIPHLWLVAVGLCGLVVLLFFLRGPRNQQAPAATSPSLPSQQTISIRPLETPPLVETDQPDQEADPVAPFADGPTSSSPALNVGSLQIEKSPRE